MFFTDLFGILNTKIGVHAKSTYSMLYRWKGCQVESKLSMIVDVKRKVRLTGVTLFFIRGSPVSRFESIQPTCGFKLSSLFSLSPSIPLSRATESVRKRKWLLKSCTILLYELHMWCGSWARHQKYKKEKKYKNLVGYFETSNPLLTPLWITRSGEPNWANWNWRRLLRQKWLKEACKSLSSTLETSEEFLECSSEKANSFWPVRIFNNYYWNYQETFSHVC